MGGRGYARRQGKVRHVFLGLEQCWIEVAKEDSHAAHSISAELRAQRCGLIYVVVSRHFEVLQASILPLEHPQLSSLGLQTHLIAQLKSCGDLGWALELRIPLEQCLYRTPKEVLLMLVQL